VSWPRRARLPGKSAERSQLWGLKCGIKALRVARESGFNCDAEVGDMDFRGWKTGVSWVLGAELTNLLASYPRWMEAAASVIEAGGHSLPPDHSD
jgi:hypothetical protein